MEGYFWRVSEPRSGLVLVALCGVSLGPTGRWTAVALGASPDGFLRQAIAPSAWAAPTGLGVSAGREAEADEGRLRVELGADARLEVRFAEARKWPPRAFGGLGPAQSIPGLGQYWHPHLLGARVEGHAVLGERTVDLDGATAYGEKNWGAGFPRRWWWGQAQGFDDAEVCVAFAGGVLERGPIAVPATSVVVHLGPDETLRVVPPLAVTHAHASDGTWRVRARSPRHRVELEGDANGTDPHLLPVPIPAERRVVNTAPQHLAGRMRVEVRRGRRLRLRAESTLAGLEVGPDA
jgi:hypothetical protein